jgi:hypothetical protein
MAQCAHDECRRWRPDLLVRYARIGLRVDGAWFCSPACVEFAARRRLRSRHPTAGTTVPPVPALRLGVLLLHQGAITSTQLARALAAQPLTGRRLGAQLQDMKLADAEIVLRGLSAQAGVSYLTAVDPACVRSAPGGLSTDEVRALGVVPIQVDEANRLLIVACPAPVPRAALSALRQLTGWTPEPLLVTDADWQLLTRAYGSAAVTRHRRVEFDRVRDVDAAAARIAAAASEGAITVTQAHDEKATWVRVEGNGLVSTLLMPRKEDEECLAVTTSH